jgi:hypothetical protein
VTVTYHNIAYKDIFQHTSIVRQLLYKPTVAAHSGGLQFLFSSWIFSGS